MKTLCFTLLVSAALAFHSPATQLGKLWGVKAVIPEPSRHKLLADLSNEEIMDGWVDDLIYSGDMPGYVRRYGKDLLCDEFLEYLHGRVSETVDDDERESITEVLAVIQSGFTSTDGLGGDSGVAFENRLNRILFTAPNGRRSFIESNEEDMTSGFVEYIQNELRSNPDSDSKVVLASILKLIGDVKGSDLLGGAATMLQFADGGLGDDYKKEEVLDLKSIADESNAVGDRNEQILAALLFSQRDILEDILNNLHEIDDRFCNFLERKIGESQDIEERVGLQSLLETLRSVLERVSEVEGSGDGYVEGSAQEELDLDQVRRRMQEVQTGRDFEAGEGMFTSPQAAAQAFEVQEDKMDSFKAILDRFLERPVQMSLEEAARLNYDLCDYEFMEMLQAEITTCLNEGADIEAQQLQEIMSEIRKCMTRQMGSAQDRLQKILSAGHPKAMESEIVTMARKNEVDEALLLLMEANLQQAEAAGPQGENAAKVLKHLVARANAENEKKLPDEQRLLRALLRVDDSDERKGLIFEAFKRQKSIDEEGEMKEGDPLIKPPMFIRVVKSFISSFGNVDSFNIMGRAQVITKEAQEVATELYGEGMTPRQQQQFMYEKNTVSVWDLGNYEDHAMLSGEDVPWSNGNYDEMLPEDVLAEQAKKKLSSVDGVGIVDDGGPDRFSGTSPGDNPFLR